VGKDVNVGGGCVLEAATLGDRSVALTVDVLLTSVLGVLAAESMDPDEFPGRQLESRMITRSRPTHSHLLLTGCRLSLIFRSVHRNQHAL